MKTGGPDDRVRPTSQAGRRLAARRLRAPLWLARLIQDSRTLEELKALERPLGAWHDHPLYDDLLSAFTARIRALVAAPLSDRQQARRPLNTAEARRVTREIVRTATSAELDAFVQRLRLRYASSARRDEIESLARLRRDRLARFTRPDNRWQAREAGDWQNGEAAGSEA